MDAPASFFRFRLTPLVLALLRLEGASAQAFVRDAGLPAEALAGPCVAPLARVRAFMEAATARSGDATFPVRVAEAVPAGTYETAELLVRTAPTLGEGLAALTRWGPLVNPIGAFTAALGARDYAVEYRVAGPEDGLGPTMNVFTIAYLLRGLRAVVDGPLAPRRFFFAHSAPEPRVAALLEGALGAPTTYRAPASGLLLAPEDAARPLRSADPVVFAYLEREAARAAAASPAAPFAALVLGAIGDVGLPDADLSAVARRLATTERTAQRRLREEGVAFRDLLTRARKSRSEELRGRGLKDEQIAPLLGFADVSAYRRARRRW